MHCDAGPASGEEEIPFVADKLSTSASFLHDMA